MDSGLPAVCFGDRLDGTVELGGWVQLKGANANDIHMHNSENTTPTILSEHL